HRPEASAVAVNVFHGCRLRTRRSLRLPDRKPPPVAQCGARLLRDGVEPTSPLWPASSREKRPLQSQSGSAVSARRVPRGENSGVSCGLSKQHEGKFSGTRANLLAGSFKTIQRFRSQLSVPYFC